MTETDDDIPSELVGKDMSRRVCDLLAGPGELWIVEGAGHGGMSAPEMVAYREFF